MLFRKRLFFVGLLWKDFSFFVGSIRLNVLQETAVLTFRPRWISTEHGCTSVLCPSLFRAWCLSISSLRVAVSLVAILGVLFTRTLRAKRKTDGIFVDKVRYVFQWSSFEVITGPILVQIERLYPRNRSALLIGLWIRKVLFEGQPLRLVVLLKTCVLSSVLEHLVFRLSFKLKTAARRKHGCGIATCFILQFLFGNVDFLTLSFMGLFSVVTLERTLHAK